MMYIRCTRDIVITSHADINLYNDEHNDVCIRLARELLTLLGATLERWCVCWGTTNQNKYCGISGGPIHRRSPDILKWGGDISPPSRPRYSAPKRYTVWCSIDDIE